MRGHPNDYNIHAVNQVNLTNHFLIAMPSMADPHFSRTLTYICEHSDKGTMGIVVNRPLPDVDFGDLLSQLHMPNPI